MREICKDCGHTWGVSMEPRADVRCAECARPKPWRRPAHYWASRVWNFHGFEGTHIRSAEWWDARSALQDLKYAAELAKELVGHNS
jgi:hypothetical protein